MQGDFSILSTAILLIFVLDPFGNVPVLLSILKDIEIKRSRVIIIRELLIGLGILLVFLFLGKSFLGIFGLEAEAVQLSGALIFFVIGIKMIFPGNSGSSSLYGTKGEPFIVPIAMPLVAGPSALATLLVLTKSNPDHTISLFVSLLLAWFIASVIMYLAPFLHKILKNRALIALERLMGMLLLMLSVQMFIDGIRGLIRVGV